MNAPQFSHRWSGAFAKAFCRTASIETSSVGFNRTAGIAASLTSLNKSVGIDYATNGFSPVITS